MENRAQSRRWSAKKIKESVYAPLTRKDGLSPRKIIHQIQDVVAPVDYTLIKSQERMEEALNQLLKIQQDLDKMKAKDFHELAKCIDTESMALGAEMFYRASLMRTESRGFHYREDYPEMDNKKCLKWIFSKNVNGKMKPYTEDIPMHKYPYKPVNV